MAGGEVSLLLEDVVVFGGMLGVLDLPNPLLYSVLAGLGLAAFMVGTARLLDSAPRPPGRRRAVLARLL